MRLVRCRSIYMVVAAALLCGGAIRSCIEQSAAEAADNRHLARRLLCARSSESSWLLARFAGL